MKLTDAYQKLNTLYIISKGRPQCRTAKMLLRLDYPGEWFIVCGNNDETLPEYLANWGKERVLVFNWKEEVKHTDFLDNLGVEKYASGAAPARNATADISYQRGELRHWQLDDDYPSAVKFMQELRLNKRLTGAQLQFEMVKIALYGYQAGLANVGFQTSAASYPKVAFKFSRRVFNSHNLPSEPEKFVKWRGRMNDDTVNALDIIKAGKYELAVNYIAFATIKTQTETGGNTGLYQDNGTVMKTAYAIMVSPLSVSLVVKFHRYHHQNNWLRISPKVIREEHVRL